MNPSESNAFPHEREHFRVPYAPSDSPHFAMGRKIFRVWDLSEGGLRLYIADKQKPITYVLDQPVHGTLELPRKRGILQLSGQLIRISEEYLAIRLDRDSQIPLSHIMEEQRVMIQNMPEHALLNFRAGLRRV